MQVTSKLLGITAISIGITRMILNIEEFGYFDVFNQFAFYFHVGIFMLGILAYVGGSK